VFGSPRSFWVMTDRKDASRLKTELGGAILEKQPAGEAQMSHKEIIDALKDNSGDMFSFLCRHLVCLAGTYQPIDANEEPNGPVQPFIYPAWILSICDTWCLVTAGHILKRLDEPLNSKRIRLTGCVLVDSLGPDAVSPLHIPFDYQRLPKFYIEDEEAGLDFGLIALSPYYRGLLEINKILPVTERDWQYQDKLEFGQYMMVGFPKELTEIQSPRNGLIPVSVYPTVIWVTKLENPPDDLPDTRHPRFVGKLSDDFPLDSIVGMSGGPIFGFAKEGDRYWIVAVQSSWLPERKLTFGCPVPVFARLIENLLSDTTNG
jgi:hypothetical protein